MGRGGAPRRRGGPPPDPLVRAGGSRSRQKPQHGDLTSIVDDNEEKVWRSKLISEQDLVNCNRSDFNINLNSMTEHLCAIESDDNINLCNSLPVYLPSKKEVMSESNEILAKILSWMNKDQVCSPDINKTDGCQNVSEVILNDNFPPNRPSLNFNMWRSVGPVSADSPKFDETIEKRSHSLQQLGTKVEMVYNLLSMLSTHDREKMTKTLLLMTNSPDSCMAMRKSGCLPLLVQLLHGGDESPTVKEGAAQALRNIVHSNSDEKQGRREARVLRLLEQVRDYYEKLPSNVPPDPEQQDDNHIGQVVAALMKFSFDEEHRHAMCQLGALQTISKLILVDHKVHGSNTVNQHSITLRRFAGMTMTNLTFGDSANKSLVCSMSSFMAALVSQLESPSEDLRQVTASVLRNLSWRADERSKIALREVNAITALVKAAMRAEKESTLKSILSALWNFSTHSQENKADICAVEGCLQYLVKMLTYQAPSKTLSINENAGGILRNVSCQIAVREDYRQILRENNCLATLLQLLRSPSLAVVSNACCTLWNFSAQSEKDQQLLWDLGAVPLLRSLVNSKHKMISLGSSATLKNLLAARPDWDPFNKANKGMPGLSIRKRKAFEQELDVNLADTCDNIEVDEERWDGNVTATKSTPSAGQYAETDLDQPTNYSLRYAEDDSSEKIVDQEVPRTYCTEGTPCNISSATSVTDLRPSATDGKGIDEEKEVCTHTSPAESLHSIPNHPESRTPNDINDGKNMIMETPLMFSRASSLDSVSTPPDHPDDRSSVVSEFRFVLRLVYYATLFSTCLFEPISAVYYPVPMTHNPLLNIQIKLDQLASQLLHEKPVSKPSKTLENTSREIHEIISAKWQNVFIQSNITKWLCLNSKKSAFLIGLQAKSFVFLSVRDPSKLSTVNSSLTKVSVLGEPIVGDTFRLWNIDLKLMTFNLLLVVNTDSDYSLRWYQFINDQAVLHSVFALPEPVHHVIVVPVSLRLISLQSTQTEDKAMTLRFFLFPSNISLNALTITLIQTLVVPGLCRDPLFLQIHQNSFIIVTSITKGMIHVYSHSGTNNEIYFQVCTKIHVVGLKHVAVFQANSFGYLAVVGDVSQVIKFTPCSHVEKFVMHNWVFKSFLPIPVPSWRTNDILLGKTAKSFKVAEFISSNLTYRNINLLSSSKNSMIQLLHVIDFPSCAVLHLYGKDLWIFCPTQMKGTMILHLLFGKSRRENSVGSKLHKLIIRMTSLQAKIDTQLLDVSELMKQSEKILNTRGDIVTSAWSFDSISSHSVSLKDNFSFIDIQVNDLKFRETQRLRIKLDEVLWKSTKFQLFELTNHIQAFKDKLTVNNDWAFQQASIVPRKFRGELKVTGFASFYRLIVTESINGIASHEFFENIVRLDKPRKIIGPKIFTSLYVENLIVNKILNVSAEQLLFDDVFLDLTGVSFEFKELRVLSNVTVKKSQFIDQLQFENVFQVNIPFPGKVHFDRLASEFVFAKELNASLDTTVFKCLFHENSNLSLSTQGVDNFLLGPSNNSKGLIQTNESSLTLPSAP
ncbi:uncharacterized protein [Bemisia tabaci]